MKNPVSGIQHYRELNLVENYMDDAQLYRLLTVLRTDKNRAVCSIVLYLLSTGARLNEALQAQWRFIDTEHRVWRIPATNSKSGKVRSVPLNDSALDILSQLDTKDESNMCSSTSKQGGHTPPSRKCGTDCAMRPIWGTSAYMTSGTNTHRSW